MNDQQLVDELRLHALKVKGLLYQIEIADKRIVDLEAQNREKDERSEALREGLGNLVRAVNYLGRQGLPSDKELFQMVSDAMRVADRLLTSGKGR